MPRFDPTKACFAFNAFADLTRLNRLDDLWTSYLLRERGPVPTADAEGLALITSEMRDLLGRVGGHVERLREFINQQQENFDLAFKNTIAATALSPNQRSAVEQVVREAGGFARFASDQLALIQNQSGEESRLLQDKMIRIRDHGITEGDFKVRFKCALKIAMLAATIGVLVYTGTILLPAITAAVALGPMAVVAAFIAAGGLAFLKDGTGLISEIADVIEECFPRKKNDERKKD